MHRIVPDFVIENYRAGRRRGTFRATGMFVDLSGFSTITDVLMRDRQHGAEQLSALLYSVFEPVVRAIFEHGGIILGFAGDALTAVYPDEADPQKVAWEALASAWSIRQSLASMASLQTSYGSFPISAKVGIAYGDLAWVIVESGDHRKATYYFRGSAVEGPAEAEHQARAGDIVLGPSVRAMLANRVQVEANGEFARLTGLLDTLPASCPIGQQPVDQEIARLFVPEVLLAEGLRGEFRQVVNLFVQIPPLSDDDLEPFITTVFDLQERYAGLISRLDFGDKGCNMLMLWGAPTAYENDISRALNFAVDLRSALDFPIAAGITFQMAHAGYMGSKLFEDYTCSGWGVNLAARLMTRAGSGSIWLDQRVVQRVSKTFDVEDLGQQDFKGFAQPQHIYSLKGRKAEADSLYLGALSGREAELRQLGDHIQPLWRGQFAGVTVVRGEAGIGKSRLVQEFRSETSLADREVLWAICPSDQILRQSLYPFRHWLLRYFNLVSQSDDAARLQSFNTVFDGLIRDISDESLIDDLRRLRSFVAALVDLHWNDSLYERLDAQARYDNTVLALIALIKAESVRRPVILFVEDAHALDEDSELVLLRLKRSLLSGASFPVAILMTARAEDTELLVTDRFADHILDLTGLSAEAMVALSNEILGRPAAEELLRFVEGRAEGNPFFAEQILHYLREESLLELNSSGNWTVSPGWQSSGLPMDITAMLIARLDQLARQVKEVVQTASVLGREFEIHVLGWILKEDSALEDEVTEASRASIWSPLSQLRYMFRHSLLRDAAYSMQLLAHRRELHALSLEALESLYADELPSHYPELAYHSEQAALAEKACLYLRNAADTARDAYQNAQAVDFYTRLLAFVPKEELSSRFDILVERALLYRRLGNRNSEAADLDSLDRIAEALGELGSKARVSMLRAKYVLSLGDFQRSAEYARHAAEWAWAASDVEVALGAHLILPEASLRQGHLEEAMRQAEETLRLAQHHERQAEQGTALNLMGLIALEQKRGALVRVFLEASLEIARLCSDRALEAKSLNNLGRSAGEIERDWGAARHYYEQAYAIVHERGDRPAEGIALINLGMAAGAQGDFSASRSYHDRALSITREIGDPYHEAYTLINLSAVAGMQGDASNALQFATAAVDLASRIGDRSGEAWGLLYKGHALLAARNLEAAEQAFQTSVSIWDEQGQPGLAAEPLTGLILAALEKNDMAAAREWTERIMTHLEAGGTLEGTDEPLRVYLACYHALRAQGDSRSETVLHIARKMLDAQLSKFPSDDARRMYVENVPWRLGVLRASNAGEATYGDIGEASA